MQSRKGTQIFVYQTKSKMIRINTVTSISLTITKRTSLVRSLILSVICAALMSSETLILMIGMFALNPVTLLKKRRKNLFDFTLPVHYLF